MNQIFIEYVSPSDVCVCDVTESDGYRGLIGLLVLKLYLYLSDI